MIREGFMKAVAFDLDDTLLHDDLSISSYTIQTLNRLHDSGIKIVPASGRAQLSMLPLISRFGCADLYIASNGAEIWEGGTNRLLHGVFFYEDLAREIVAFGKKHRCYMHTYQDDCFLFSEYSSWAEKYAASSLLKGIYVGDLENCFQEPRNKILMIDEEEKIAEMLKEAQFLFEGRLSVTSSKAHYLEFNPLGATKGAALERVSRLLSIQCGDFISFGDSLNDLPMLQISGISVAMQNGRAEVRSQCDAVCLSNNEDGVACFLNRYFFPREMMD